MKIGDTYRGLIALFGLLSMGGLLLGTMPPVVLAGFTPTPTPMTPQVTATSTPMRPVQTPTPAPQDEPTPTVTATPLWVLPETGEVSSGIAALWLMPALLVLLVATGLVLRRVGRDTQTPPT